MAKTLLEFDGELLDVMTIFRISRKEIWDANKNGFVFCLVFNPDLPEKYIIRDLYFKYESAEFREKKITELKNKIGNLEHILIL